MKHQFSKLSARIIVALFLFVLALALATTGLMLRGFNRTQKQATLHSVNALQTQGEQAVQALADYEANLIATRFQHAANLTQIAVQHAENLYKGNNTNFEMANDVINTLTIDQQGNRFDTNPERITDIWIPYYTEITDEIRLNLELSTTMDSLFPSMLTTSDDTVALYYQTDEMVMRYYPVVNLHDKIRDNSYALSEDFLEHYTYQVAPESNPERATVWDPPYIDTAGQGLMITVYTPIYLDDTYQGFIAADLTLNNLIARMDALKPSTSGYGMLIAPDGRIIAVPERANRHFTEIEYQVLDSSEAIDNWFSPDIGDDIRAVLYEMPSDTNGSFDININGDDLLIAYERLPNVEWTLLTVALVDELIAEASFISDEIANSAEQTISTTLITMSLFFIGALLVTSYLSRRWLLHPISSLAQATQSVASGDLNIKLTVNRDDELGTLADAFNQMATDLRQYQSELEQRVADRTRELSVLYDVTAVASASLEMDTVLTQSLERVCAVMVSLSAIVHRWQDEKLVMTAQHGKRLYDSLNQHPAQTVIETHETLVIQSLSTVDKISLTYVGVPMRSKGKVIGVLSVLRPAEQLFSVDEVALLASVGDQIGIAVDNARLYQQSEQLAVVQERQRLARELHDAVTQSVYSVTLMAEAAKRATTNEQWDTVINLVERLQDIGGQALKEMRLLVYELRPLALKQEGLVGAIRHRLDAVERRAGMNVTLKTEGDILLADAIEQELYRIIQESLNNALKHANAQSIQITFIRESNTLMVTIADDGVGFILNDAINSGGIGLQSLRERAEKIAATLKIDSVPENGTTITLHIPLKTQTIS